MRVEDVTPVRLLPVVRPVVPHLRRVRWWGRARWCPCCRSSIRLFLPHGAHGRPDARCPVCGSLERTRNMWLYLRDELDLPKPNTRVLHIAPEPALERSFRRIGADGYLTFDLQRPGVDVTADLTASPLPDGEFDLIVASHVLEHIDDDAAAMRELRRMLRPDGVAVLIVPWRPGTTTFEDPSVTEPTERARLFGQWDHVRWYGDDVVERFRDAGLTVSYVRYAQRLPGEDVRRMGLERPDHPDRDGLWVCRPAAALPSRSHSRIT